MEAFVLAVPLDEGAVAETDGAFAGDLGDLIAGSPEGAVDEADVAAVGFFDADHGGVGTVEADEFAVGDEQRVGGTVIDGQGGLTVVGADTEEVSVAGA